MGDQGEGPGLFSYNTLVHAIAGSMASVTAMSSTYPLDNIRAKIQLDQLDPNSSTFKILIQILRQEGGVAELYRGIVPTLQSLCASNFVYFYVFHGLKSQSPHSSAVRNLWIGAVAGAINVLVTTPLWVVNTRIKIGGTYAGLLDGLRKILREEGVGALWAGTGPSLILVLNPAIVFMVYEGLKKRFRGAGTIGHFFLGAIAKCIATVLTYPLQIIQTKLRNGESAKSSVGLLSRMIRTSGPRSIYKGMESKLYQTVTTAALMFAFYEKIAQFVFLLLGLNHRNRKA